MNGNEAEIIKIFTTRTNYVRQLLREAYKSCYGTDLTQDLEDKLGGNFCKAILAMVHTPWEYDSHQLRKAMKGLGTDEDTLIEIIASRTSSRLKMIKEEFQKHYNKNLEKEVESETSGEFRKLLVSLLQGARSENVNPNPEQCKKDAQDLYAAGKGWGTDEHIFNKIFTQRSHNEMGLIAQYFYEITGTTFFDEIESEFSGDAKKKTLKTILYVLINPAEYFATRVNKAIKGWGTDDGLLIRVLVSRDEIDLPKIKEQYQRLYKVSMIDDIIGDTSGDYKNLLVAIASRHLI